MIGNKKIIEELKQIGFVTRTLYGKKHYIYKEKESFSLHVVFYHNKFICSQIAIHKDNIHKWIDVRPEDKEKIIKKALKTMKIVDRLNKLNSKIDREFEVFDNL